MLRGDRRPPHAPDGAEGVRKALSRPHAKAMDFTGRPMSGLVYVEPAGFASPRDIKTWIEKAMEFALSLPAKEFPPDRSSIRHAP